MKCGSNKKKSYDTKKEEAPAAPATSTSSVVGAGDNPSGTVVIDKRKRKDKPPRVLKRFSRFM